MSWIQDFGWKKKAEHLRMTLLAGAHQLARELQPGLRQILALFREVARTGDGRGLQEQIEAIGKDEYTPLWEPIEVHGWKISATMYLDNGQIWWLLHAQRPTSRAPGEKDLAILDKVLEHLGADPKRDLIIGPRSSPPNAKLLPFGWWAWFNQMPLYEIQVNRDKKNIRVVPLGALESDGYLRIETAALEDTAARK